MDKILEAFRNYFAAYEQFERLVEAFSKLTPNSNNKNAVIEYLKIMNFLWTEYDYLYTGKSISAYQIQKKKEKSSTIYHDATQKKLSEMMKKVKEEKDEQKKKEYKSILVANRTKCDAISYSIGHCQKTLKESAREILAHKQLSSLKISIRNAPGTSTPYIQQFTTNTDNDTTIFESECTGYNPASIDEEIQRHQWFPQTHPPHHPPPKKQKLNSRKAVVASSSSSSSTIRRKKI